MNGVQNTTQNLACARVCVCVESEEMVARAEMMEHGAMGAGPQREP